MSISFVWKLQILCKETVLLNPFVPNAPFLYPLKTSENLTEKTYVFKG